MNENLRIGVIGVKDGWSSQRLADAVEAKTGFRCLIDMAEVALDLGNGRMMYEEHDLSTFDALIVKKIGSRYSPELLDRLAMLRFLHQRGVRVFSNPAAMKRLLDRLSCTVSLRLADIPMPATVVTEDIELAVQAVEQFGRAILKPLFTSKARGMQVVTAGTDSRERIWAFREAGNHVLYVQQMVELPGHDLGVVFLGGSYLGTYARVAHDASWNTSTRSGGKYRPYDPPESLIDLARRAQAPFQLDFTCVDIVESDQGPLVFEVSALGGFRGLLQACDIDAAERYASYVIESVSHAVKPTVAR